MGRIMQIIEMWLAILSNTPACSKNDVLIEKFYSKYNYPFKKRDLLSVQIGVLFYFHNDKRK